MRLIALALLASTSSLASAQEDLSALEGLLDEPVVSTASMAAESSARTAPATITTITAEDLRRYGIHTLDQAVSFLSLGMQTESNLATSEIGARGVLLTQDYGSHALLLLNGHVMNEPWDGTAYFDRNAGIPFELIDHIEVIVGPGSVLYGSNAMFGVINVVTKRAKEFSGMRLTAESELPVSGRGALGFGHELTIAGMHAEVTGELEYYNTEGPRFTYGPQETDSTAIFRVNGDPDGVWGGAADKSLYATIPAGLVRALIGDLELNLRASSSRRNTPYNAWGNFDDPTSYELDRWISADARYRKRLTTQAALAVHLYGDMYSYRQNLPSESPDNCIEGQPEGCIYRLDGGSRWGGAEAQGSFDWMGDGRFVTLAGVDGKLRLVDSREVYIARRAEPTETAKYDHREGAAALYLEQVAQPLGWLGLNGGLRYDYDQRFGTHLSPRLAAVLAPLPDTTVKAIYAEAFRGPSAYERYYSDPVTQVAAPDLRPEVVRTLELSIEQRFAGQRLLVGAFDAWWRDLVSMSELTTDELAAAIDAGELRPDTTYAEHYANLSSVRNWGFNVAVDGTLVRRLHYGATAVWAHTRSHEPGEPARRLEVAPSFFGNARLAYELGGDWPTVALAARFVGPRLIDLGPDAGFAPRPVAEPQVELRATASGALSFVTGLDYRLTAAYALSGQTPYHVGPLDYPTEAHPNPDLVPVDRFRVLVTLSYGMPL